METVNATLALIPQYTGLAPGTFFTIVALVFGIYYLISGLFAPAPVKFTPAEPLPPPAQLGEITAEELRAYDGTDDSKPLLMAIKGQIYDVSQSKYVNVLTVVALLHVANLGGFLVCSEELSISSSTASKEKRPSQVYHGEHVAKVLV